MLESVGMGIAMGNAPDDIKNIAKDVTSTNNQDGILKPTKIKYYIEEFSV